jgi:dTDP-4-dehydrorhamnose 3,5-epimerase
MKIIPSELHGVCVIEPKVFGDARGYFLETWNHRGFASAGLEVDFVQDNLSYSGRGTLRGLHFQNPHPQGKLVTVLAGEVFDVVVDVRVESPTFGRWIGITLSAENRRQLYVPPGFAHGFCVTGESALFAYKCSDYYSPRDEVTLAWDDPDLGIDWPTREPVLSEKDRHGIRLKDFSKERLF